jgi:hypothetical protein
MVAITWFFLFKKITSIGNFMKNVWIEMQGFIHKASPVSIVLFPRSPFIRFKRVSAIVTLSANCLSLLMLKAFMLVIRRIRGFKDSRVQGQVPVPKQ